MSKDPAFLFYSGDFLTGTTFMSNEETGQYIKTLCLLHQHGGRLPKDKIEKAVGKLTELVLEKLQFDKENNLFNKRLIEEIDKRNSYCSSRKKNILHRYKKPTHVGTYVEHTNIHMENENNVLVSNVLVTEKDKDKNKTNIVNDTNHDKDNNIMIIINDFNEVFGTSYKVNSAKNRSFVQARLNEGFTVEDFKTVHRKMLKAWGTDEKMIKYLRPITLYSGKFESYLNMKVLGNQLSETGLKAYLIGQEWLKKHEVANVG